MIQFPLYILLAVAGAAPFAAWALLRLLEIETLPFLGHVDLTGSTYSALIITFLAGSHWGNSLHSDHSSDYRILLISNLIMLTSWLTLLLIPFGVLHVSAFIVCLIVLLLTDFHLFRKNQITENYYLTRLMVTGLVMMLLFITGVTYGTRY